MQWAVCARHEQCFLPVSDQTVLELGHVVLLLGQDLPQGAHAGKTPAENSSLIRKILAIFSRDPLALATVLGSIPPASESGHDEDAPEVALGRAILQGFWACLEDDRHSPPLKLVEPRAAEKFSIDKGQILQTVRKIFLIQQLTRNWAELHQSQAVPLIPFAAVVTVSRLFLGDCSVDFVAELRRVLNPKDHKTLDVALEVVETCHGILGQLGEGAKSLQLDSQLLAPLEGTQACDPGEAKQATDGTACSADAVTGAYASLIGSEEVWRAAEHRACRLARRWGRSVPGCRGLWETVLLVTRRLARLNARFAEALEHAKLDAMAEFAAGAGHEINNPLAIISGHAQVLLRQVTHPEWQRMLAAIVAQAQRAHEMIADARLFARPPKPVFAPVNYRDIVQTVIKEYTPPAESRHVQLRLATAVEAQDRFQGMADRSQILVALGAIVKNALEAVPEKGTITLTLDADTEEVRISIADDGPGIDPKVREHLFDPFFSGRQAGRGLGMGLSKAWRIVTLHSGTIEVQSAKGSGAIFSIRLPRNPPGGGPSSSGP